MTGKRIAQVVVRLLANAFCSKIATAIYGTIPKAEDKTDRTTANESYGFFSSANLRIPY